MAPKEQAANARKLRADVKWREGAWCTVFSGFTSRKDAVEYACKHLIGAGDGLRVYWKDDRLEWTIVRSSMGGEEPKCPC